MAIEEIGFRDRVLLDWVRRYGTASVPVADAERIRHYLVDFAHEIMLVDDPADPRIVEIVSKYVQLVS